jgi:RHS repeat-associated protein
LICPSTSACTAATTGANLTVYAYDAQGQLAAEFGPSSDSGTRYLTADHLGSTRVITDSSGVAQKCYDYYPFGEDIAAGTGARPGCYGGGVYPGTGPDIASEKFTGKERDWETGLDYFGARYFSAAQGRFTSPDEFTGGIVDPFTGQQVVQSGPLPYADITDPQTLNKYAYVRNNPLRYVDPDGHAPSDLVYDGETRTLTLYSGSGDEIGSWHANNNVDSRASLGKLPDGVYPVLDQNSPHMHGNAVDAHDSNLQDSKNGEYGQGGIFRVQNFVGLDGKTHTGVGVHAGREDKPDARGRTGADHATQGCVRTCDAAIKTITDTAKKDPLKTVTVQNNRKPTPPSPAPPKKKEDPR